MALKIGIAEKVANPVRVLAWRACLPSPIRNFTYIVADQHMSGCIEVSRLIQLTAD